MVPQAVPITAKLTRGAAEAIADGFADNEIWVWILGGEDRARRILPRHYRAVIKRVFAPRGGAWTTPDTKGGALWLPPGRDELSVREQIVELTSLLPWTLAVVDRAARFDKLVRAHKPTQAHWYLNTLSIASDAQRSGVGSALIAPGLELAERDGVGVHLETQREANIPYYHRFGFELTRQISLADSPPLWLMWRPPEPGPFTG